MRRDEVFWLFADWADLAAARASAIRRAFWRVRREVWTRREQALRGQEWPGYG